MVGLVGRLQARESVSVLPLEQKGLLGEEDFEALSKAETRGISCVTWGVRSMSECSTQSMLCSGLLHHLSRGL